MWGVAWKNKEISIQKKRMSFIGKMTFAAIKKKVTQKTKRPVSTMLKKWRGK